MNKRGQVTIFIIIAILIIAFVAIYFTFLNNQKEKLDTVDADSVYNFVQSCFEYTSEEVVYYTGLGGGYYYPISDLTIGAGTPAYLVEGKNYMPSKEQIEEEISSYISRRLPFCVRNFENFPEYSISDREINVSTYIRNNSIDITMDYPIYVSKGEATEEIRDFNTEVSVRLGLIYNLVKDAINSETEDGIYLSGIWKGLEENNLYLDMFDYDNKTIVFVWRDEQSEINNKKFEYIYANVY